MKIHATGVGLTAAAMLMSLVAINTRAADSSDVAASNGQGRAVFQKWCAPCHAPVAGSEQLPGTSTLQSIYQGSKPAALEQRTDLTPTLISLYVRHGINAMPYFRKTEISDAELAALGDYLAHSTLRPNAP